MPLPSCVIDPVCFFGGFVFTVETFGLGDGFGLGCVLAFGGARLGLGFLGGFAFRELPSPYDMVLCGISALQ